MTNSEIKEFITLNPTLSINQIATELNLTYDRVQKLKKKIIIQQVTTPEGYKGILTKGKTWQVYDGSWRESLQFEVDEIAEWNKFKEEFIADLHTLGTVQKVTKKVKNKDGQVCLEISLPDAHFGKGDIKELAINYTNCIIELLTKAENFNIERILLPLGNDGLNSEGKSKATTAGTPQVDSVDWRASFREYGTVLINVINTLSEDYPIDIIIVPGNHDTERMFYIGEVLKAYFHKSTKVTIENSGEYRKYYEYGKNMLLFTHGDKEKVATLPLLMATEQPEMFARTKFREAHLGHFHKEMLNEYCGIKTRFLPSICTTDEWHKMMGYNHLRAAQAYMWHKTNGLEGYFQISLI